MLPRFCPRSPHSFPPIWTVLTTVPSNRQTVLITGGSRGLGLGAACQLAGKGASVIIAARDAGKLKESIDEISVIPSHSLRTCSTSRHVPTLNKVTSNAPCSPTSSASTPSALMLPPPKSVRAS